MREKYFTLAVVCKSNANEFRCSFDKISPTIQNPRMPIKRKFAESENSSKAKFRGHWGVSKTKIQRKENRSNENSDIVYGFRWWVAQLHAVERLWCSSEGS